MRGGRPQSGGRVNYGRVWLRRTLGLVVALWLLLPQSTAIAADPATDRDALIASLGQLKQAVDAKIDSDIEDVAWAFWSVHEIEKARFCADFFLVPLTAVEQGIATLSAAKHLDDLVRGITRASTPLGLAAYVTGTSQIHQAVAGWRMAWNGPAYSTAMRTLYDQVGAARSLQDAVRIVNALLNAAEGPRALLPARAPEQAHASGAPEFVDRPSEVARLVGSDLDELARELAAAAVELKPAVLAELRARVEQATATIKRSKGAPLAAEAVPALGRAEDVTFSVQWPAGALSKASC